MAGHIPVEHTTFEDIGGRTRLTTRNTLANKEDRDGMLQAGMEEGASESLDRLEAIPNTIYKYHLKEKV